MTDRVQEANADKPSSKVSNLGKATNVGLLNLDMMVKMVS